VQRRARNRHRSRQDRTHLAHDSGVVRAVSPTYAAEQLEHGYALTGHAAQGATVERSFVLLRDQGALQEWGYVACSRARAETRLYIAEQTPEPEAHGREPTGPSTDERVARVLTTSASEPLALDHTSRISDATARARATRFQQLEQLRARAEHRLAAAEAEPQNLGWRNRRKNSADLRAEIAIQRAATRPRRRETRPAAVSRQAQAHRTRRPRRH
jgi:hypothetical protein